MLPARDLSAQLTRATDGQPACMDLVSQTRMFAYILSVCVCVCVENLAGDNCAVKAVRCEIGDERQRMTWSEEERQRKR